MDPAAWGIVVTVALALIGGGGVLWRMLNNRIEKDIDRVEQRLSAHIAEDIKVHERVVRLETRGEVDNREINELRERTRNMRHDILGEVTKTMLGWYTDAVERLMKLFKP